MRGKHHLEFHCARKSEREAGWVGRGGFLPDCRSLCLGGAEAAHEGDMQAACAGTKNNSGHAVAVLPFSFQVCSLHLK